MRDPDLGNYAYDAASRLIGQTGAKLQANSFSYDVMGRVKTNFFINP